MCFSDIAMSVPTVDEWKNKYLTLVEVIRGAAGQKVLNSLLTLAEREEGKKVD